jgi:hypothetical protein
VRATLVFLLALCCGANLARAQATLEVGAPASAFAGGPIHLTRNETAALRAHYQGDKVPLVPQPFRGRLDTALLGRDWPRVEAEKKALVAAHGMMAALLWEQSRFIATGSIGVAEMHALDIAGTGASALSESAVMLWFYAAAVTLTDGHECVDEAARDAHLERLRGPAFEPVLRLVRTIGEDRLAAMRDLAIRLETVLAVDRNDDTMCRTGNEPAQIKPDAVWRPEAAATRGMLPRHLLALASIMRPRPAGGSMGGAMGGSMAAAQRAKPEPVRPVVATPMPRPSAPETVEPVFPGAGLSLPMLPPLALPTPAAARPARPVQTEPPNVAPGPAPAAAKPELAPPNVATSPAAATPDTTPTAPPNIAPTQEAAAPAKAEPSRTGTATPVTAKIEPSPPAPPTAAVVDPNTGQPNPARFEPPDMQLTTPANPTNH